MILSESTVNFIRSIKYYLHAGFAVDVPKLNPLVEVEPKLKPDILYSLLHILPRLLEIIFRKASQLPHGD